MIKQIVKIPTKDDNGFSKQDRKILVEIFQAGIDRMDNLHRFRKCKTRDKMLFEYLVGVHQTLSALNHPLSEYFARLMVFVFQMRDPYLESKELIKTHLKAIGGK